MEVLINSLLALADKDDVIANRAISHAEKILTAIQSGQYTQAEYQRDFSIGIEIIQQHIDRLGEVLENAWQNSEYIPVTLR